MTQKRQRRRWPRMIFLILFLAVAVLFYDSNTRIVISEYECGYTEDILPTAFDGFRITQLSDIHGTQFGKDNKQLIQKVAETEPDIIVITGDLIDSDTQLDMVLPLAEGLSAIAPVYYVTGNHEWDSVNIRELFEILERGGVTTLRGEYVELTRGDESIVLAGIDDPNGYPDRKTLPDLVSEIREDVGDSYIVLLAHRNTMLYEAWELDVNMVLCGHAHGGMVRLPFTDGLVGPARDLFPNYTSGAYWAGETVMIVSRGLGNNLRIPSRFLNNPHLPVVILRAA